MGAFTAKTKIKQKEQKKEREGKQTNNNLNLGTYTDKPGKTFHSRGIGLHTQKQTVHARRERFQRQHTITY